MPSTTGGKFLILDPYRDFAMLRGLASRARIDILQLLHDRGPTNVNLIAATLALPQSSVSSHLTILEEAGLIETWSNKGRKGKQKLCRALHDELVIAFGNRARTGSNSIEVAMPVGLYSTYDVTAPCGLCTTDNIVGMLDVPETFFNPERMKAGLVWFTSGYVEYQFPNNARLTRSEVSSLEFSMELSSEVPGTNADWPSDISVSVNGIELGLWTSPGDFGDRRGALTPSWWKLKGSQYGLLKRWSVNHQGTFIDSIRLSDVTIDQLRLAEHHSIKLRIGVNPNARHPGGINIFGRGFGNHDQDIVLRLNIVE
ncbi:ArsR/SmtB family transcription factor [Kushneria aurantia]|uniref:ArsR/SmtB family transcription factor n=1 Tax=Kushneria aurantia TaxID=504092 RepID=A0ABV6G294_9GAMM|nr:helix-turn-helix domain-containing protein [Kushneria aurantia]